MAKATLEERVTKSANSILQEQKHVSFLDILIAIRWLDPGHVHDWRKGKISFIESEIQVGLEKIRHAIEVFQSWSDENNLKPLEIDYFMKTSKEQKNLQFSISGDKKLETIFRTHYFSPELSEKKIEKLKEKLTKLEDIVVFMIVKSSTCSKCSKELFKGSMLYMENDEPLCLECAGLEHLVYLSAGDAKLTRLAKQYSGLWCVVVRYSRARKRYERQGLLVEEEALERAEEEII